MYRGETLITGIGQGFITVTPLQLAVATTAIANKGILFQPTLLKNTQASDDIIIVSKKDSYIQIPIKNIQNWEDVIDGMKQAIYAPKGTGRNLNKALPYTLKAGKTGTAQVFSFDNTIEQYFEEKLDEKLRDHALFTGFCPY